MLTPYSLVLTQGDVATIGFVGGRYCWSDALRGLEIGNNLLTEPEAWEIRDAFEADAALFPLLAGDSELYAKLLAFMDSIV